MNARVAPPCPVSDASIPSCAEDRTWDMLERFTRCLFHDLRNRLNSMELQLTLAGELTEDPVPGGEIARARAGIAETAQLLAGLRRHLLPPEICLVQLAAKDVAEMLLADAAIPPDAANIASIPCTAMLEIDLNGLLEGIRALIAEMPDASKIAIRAEPHALRVLGAEWCDDVQTSARPAFLSGTQDYGLRLEMALRLLPAAGVGLRWQAPFAFEITIPFLPS